MARIKLQRWKLLALGAAVLCIVAGSILFFLYHHSETTHSSLSKQPTTSPQNKAAQTQSSSPNTIHLLAAGDFLAHDSVNGFAKQADGSYNYLPIMDQFPQIFSAADIRFCNDAQLNGGAQFGLSGWPKFNSPPEFARDMAKEGCNVVNTGTNHSFDRNQAAIDATVDTWSKQPNMLAVAGQNRSTAEHDTVHYFTVKGVKIAFLAYTTYLNNDAPAQTDYGVNVFSKDFAASQIAAAKQNGANFIITSIRWGTEYSPNVDAAQKANAQWLADQGVNLVLGHGSHVLQSVQELTGSGGNKTLVWYSLGNFIGTQIPAETLFNGLAAMDIDTKTLQVSHVSFLPIYMHYEWTAEQAQRQNDSDLLARHSLKMYFLDQATQAMIDSNQLKTTADAQRQRMQSTLNSSGMNVPLITKDQFLAQY